MARVECFPVFLRNSGACGVHHIFHIHGPRCHAKGVLAACTKSITQENGTSHVMRQKDKEQLCDPGYLGRSQHIEGHELASGFVS